MLAQYPDKYTAMLREEVEANLKHGQITSETLSNLPKMESFLREAARYSDHGLSNQISLLSL